MRDECSKLYPGARPQGQTAEEIMDEAPKCSICKRAGSGMRDTYSGPVHPACLAEALEHAPYTFFALPPA